MTTSKVPWLYSPTEHGGHFISYDDEESLQYKVDFIREQGLGGAMFWEITGDRNETLLDVLQPLIEPLITRPGAEWTMPRSRILMLR